MPVIRPINNDIQNGDANVFRFFRTVNETFGKGSKTLHRRVIDQISRLRIDRQVVITRVYRNKVAKRLNDQTSGSRFIARKRSSSPNSTQATPSPTNIMSNPNAPACRLVASGSVSNCNNRAPISCGWSGPKIKLTSRLVNPKTNTTKIAGPINFRACGQTS